MVHFFGSKQTYKLSRASNNYFLRSIVKVNMRTCFCTPLSEIFTNICTCAMREKTVFRWGTKIVPKRNKHFMNHTSLC